MESIDELRIDTTFDVDGYIEKLEKMKNLLTEIKSLADDIFGKQESN